MTASARPIASGSRACDPTAVPTAKQHNKACSSVGQGTQRTRMLVLLLGAGHHGLDEDRISSAWVLQGGTGFHDVAFRRWDMAQLRTHLQAP